MDLTEGDLSIAMQEAFDFYLSFLSYFQKLRDSKLPRQGKARETPADLSFQQYYQSRVTAIETCLQYTEKVARRVRNWASDPWEKGNSKNPNGTESLDFETCTLNGYQLPCLGFFAEILNHKIPASSHHSNNEATIEISGDILNQPETDFQYDTNEESGKKSVQSNSRIRSPHTDASSRLDYIRNRNAANPAISTFSKRPNAAPSNTDFNNTWYSTTSSPGSMVEPKDGRTFDGRIKHGNLKLKDDRASTDRVSDGREIEDDTRSVSSETAFAFYLQQGDKTSKVYDKEAEQAKRRAQEIFEVKHADQQARAEEARVIQRQQQYAEALARLEAERLERGKRVREAALKAQQEQERWEIQEIARETAAMRAEERRRREDSEKRYRAERERQLRIDRETRWAEETRQQNSAANDEASRREAESAQWRKQERERRANIPSIDCLACMEAGDRREMVTLPCGHAYCAECIKGGFKAAYKSRSPFKCCNTPVSIKVSTVSCHLTRAFVQKYSKLMLELSTTQPKYCSLSTCSQFLPPSTYHQPTLICQACKTRTCALCTKEEHPGICKQDKDGIRVEKLAKRKGWKMCPSCSIVVEKTEGCLHISCRCGAQWCYSCLRDWGACGGSCERARTDEEYRGEGRQGGPGRVTALLATALLMALTRD